MRGVGWVPAMQRFVGQAYHSDLYPQSSKMTLEDVGGGGQLPKFQNHHTGCNRKTRAEEFVTAVYGQGHEGGFPRLLRDPSTEAKGRLDIWFWNAKERAGI